MCVYFTGYAFMCVLFVHYLYRLPCPTVDPRGISSALFDNDAVALGSLAARHCVMTLSLMLRLAVHAELINLLVSGRSVSSNEILLKILLNSYKASQNRRTLPDTI